MRWSVGTVLLVIAIICFVVEALIDTNVNLVAVGLAFFAASFLVGDLGWRRP